jgi:hypothetical protein
MANAPSTTENRLHAEFRRQENRHGPTSDAVAKALNALFCALRDRYHPEPIPEDVLACAARELSISCITTLSPF